MEASNGSQVGEAAELSPKSTSNRTCPTIGWCNCPKYMVGRENRVQVFRRFKPKGLRESIDR